MTLVPKKIKTFNTTEFLEKYMKPDEVLKQVIKQDYGQFFIIKVQDLIKASKLPVPPTRSNTHTIIFLTKGVATMKSGFTKIKIKKNECAVVPAGQVFSYDKYDINKGFILNFDPSFIEAGMNRKNLPNEFEFLTIWANPIIKPDAATATNIAQVLKRILAEYTANGLMRPQIILSYLIAALCELNASYKPFKQKGSNTATALVNAFKRLLHQHFKTHHQVTYYAQLLNVSPNHLNKTVKQVSGKTVSKWMDELIVAETKVLLLQTQLPVANISEEVGIYDHSYFSRMFKKYEKVSPLQFRKMIEKS